MRSLVRTAQKTYFAMAVLVRFAKTTDRVCIPNHEKCFDPDFIVVQYFQDLTVLFFPDFPRPWEPCTYSVIAVCRLASMSF